MNSLFTHRKRKILLLTVNTGKISLFYPQKTVAKYQYRKKKLLQIKTETGHQERSEVSILHTPANKKRKAGILTVKKGVSVRRWNSWRDYSSVVKNLLPMQGTQAATREKSVWCNEDPECRSQDPKQPQINKMEWLACDVCSNSIILGAFLKTQNASNLISTNHKIITTTEETNSICKIFINYTNIYWTFTRKHYSSARNTVMRRTKFPHLWRKPIWLEMKRWNTRGLAEALYTIRLFSFYSFWVWEKPLEQCFSACLALELSEQLFK